MMSSVYTFIPASRAGCYEVNYFQCRTCSKRQSQEALSAKWILKVQVLELFMSIRICQALVICLICWRTWLLPCQQTFHTLWARGNIPSNLSCSTPWGQVKVWACTFCLYSYQRMNPVCQLFRIIPFAAMFSSSALSLFLGLWSILGGIYHKLCLFP